MDANAYRVVIQVDAESTSLDVLHWT